jgi:hypothetical protein
MGDMKLPAHLQPHVRQADGTFKPGHPPVAPAKPAPKPTKKRP